MTGTIDGLQRGLAKGGLDSGLVACLKVVAIAAFNEKGRAVDRVFNDRYIGDQGVIPSDALEICLLYTSPSPRDLSTSRMPSSA